MTMLDLTHLDCNDPLELLEAMFAHFAARQPAKAAEFICRQGWGQALGQCDSIPRDADERRAWVASLWEAFNALGAALSEHGVRLHLVSAAPDGDFLSLLEGIAGGDAGSA